VNAPEILEKELFEKMEAGSHVAKDLLAFASALNNLAVACAHHQQSTPTAKLVCLLEGVGVSSGCHATHILARTMSYEWALIRWNMHPATQPTKDDNSSESINEDWA
jgi:hypothetical protein